MWKSLLGKKKARLGARIPDAVRIYAIGDVHGRLDLLNQVFERIDSDLTNHPVESAIQVLIGDYIDRGPHSRQVLDRLIARCKTHQLVCLKGNHETFVAEYLNDPAVMQEWRRYGGLETLVSYGVIPPSKNTIADHLRVTAEFRQLFPDEHRKFLEALVPHYVCGDFFFVHAGVRPGVALAKQQEADLLWIREDFLLHEENFSKVIVHGHTPVLEPDVRSNRVNIDTGAYATGRLTCLVVERDELFFI